VAVPFDLAQITSKTNRSRAEDGLPAGTLSKESQMHVAMAFQSSQSVPQTAPTLTSNGDAHSGYRDEHGLVPVPMVNMQGSKGNAVAQEDGPSFTLSAMHGHDGHAIAVAYDIHGIPATTGASPTDVHTPLRARTPGSSEASTTTVAMVPVAYSIMPMNSGKDYKARETDIAQPIMAGGPVGGNQGGDFIAQPCVTSMQAVAFAQNTRDEVREMPVIGALAAQPGMKQTSYVRNAMQVRRLTPRECERLQGFPDDYTLIPHRNKPAADGPRYKALGNSMAVPVMRWIGERIQMVEKLNIKSG